MSVALSIQNAMRMRHIFICTMPRSTIFSTLSHKRYDFRKKSYWTQNVCFDILHNFCLRHFSILEEMLSKTYICLPVKYRIFLSYVIKTLILATYVGNTIPKLIFMKIHSGGTEFFHAERSTDGRRDGGVAGQTDRHDKAQLSLYTIF
jgi:hypothetical protein